MFNETKMSKLLAQVLGGNEEIPFAEMLIVMWYCSHDMPCPNPWSALIGQCYPEKWEIIKALI